MPILGLDSNTTLKTIGGLKGQLGLILVFNGAVDGKDICRIKEFEFAKGDNPTPNPLWDIKAYSKTKNATVSTIPHRARAGESVKVIVEIQEGAQVEDVVVKSGKGKNTVSVNQNPKAPYAPVSFNFVMPDEVVSVYVKGKC